LTGASFFGRRKGSPGQAGRRWHSRGTWV